MEQEQPQPDNIKRRGFASLSAERRREIASMGGKAHRFTSEEAREAGRKGGLVRQAKAQEPQP